MEFDRLPEDCISKVFSFTSPLDVCRSSSVSTSFQSAADSEFVWGNFLPSDYLDILSSSIIPLKFSTKKELFLRLCHPIFIDDGRKSFKLEKSSGRKSYFLSARDLSITWGNQPMYWNWVSLPESRFDEVAILRTICMLEIQGKIKTQMLSSNTLYGAYLVVKISDQAYGLDLIPFEASVEVGNQLSSSSTALLRRGEDSNKQKMQQLFYANRTQMLHSRVMKSEEARIPCEREDGWLEIELGEFFIKGGLSAPKEEVKINLKEVKGQHFKGGLIVEGLEIKPK